MEVTVIFRSSFDLAFKNQNLVLISSISIPILPSVEIALVS